jgi:LysM repeat protein
MDGAQTHTVTRGETLSAIAKRYYGGLSVPGRAGPRNGYYFPVIAMANGDIISDPDVIEPGTKLAIPDLKKNLAAPAIRQVIKDRVTATAQGYSRKSSAASAAGQRNRADIYKKTESGLRALANSL